MRNRFRRFVVGGAVAALAGGTMIAMTALSGPASADPVTFNTACTATVTGGLNLTLTVHQDVTLEASAPANVDPGATFTVTIKGGTAQLPATNTGFTINAFTDLSNTYAITGGTIVPGSLSSSGQVTNNGNPVTATSEIQGNNIVSSIPGPLTPGPLVTPDATFQVTAGAAGTPVVFKGVGLTTTAHLHGGNPPADDWALAATACTFPDNTLSSTSVGTVATTTTTAPAGPAFSVANTGLIRPDSGKVKLTFTVSLSPASTASSSVKWATSNDTAVAPDDYIAAHGSLSFGKGVTTKTFSVYVIGGQIGQPDKQFKVTLSGAKGAAIAAGSAIGLIIDKHPPGIVIDDSMLPRPIKGSKPMLFTLHLTKPAEARKKVKVTYATHDGTALAKIDYKPKVGHVTFKTGSTTATIKISIPASASSGTKIFNVTLSAAENGIIIDNSAVGNVTD